MIVTTDYDPTCTTLMCVDPESFDTTMSPAYSRRPPGFTVNGYWFSQTANNKGGFATGKIEFIIPGLPTTAILDDVLRLANRKPDPNHGDRKIRFHMKAVADNNKIWSDNSRGVADTMLNLLLTRKNLPNIPDGYLGWLKLNNRVMNPL